MRRCAGNDEVWVVGADVKAEHAAGGPADVLGEGGVLQAVQADQADLRLVVEVKGPIAHSEQIWKELLGIFSAIAII